jgi:hypothetical protein
MVPVPSSSARGLTYLFNLGAQYGLPGTSDGPGALLGRACRCSDRGGLLGRLQPSPGTERWEA